MTVLEDLWYGNIDPHEAILSDDQRFKNLLARMGRTRDELSATLTEQQKETLAKYDDAVNEMHSLAEQSAFRYGFALAARLMAESMAVELRDEDG